MTKQSKRTDLYAQRTGWANEQPLFYLYRRMPYTDMISCATSIQSTLPFPLSNFTIDPIEYDVTAQSALKHAPVSTCVCACMP